MLRHLFLFLLLFLVYSKNIVAQCIFVGDSAGNVANSAGTGNVHFDVVFQSGAYLATLNQVINSCGFDFPNVSYPFTGNTTPSLVTYVFSVPLTSVDMAIGGTGLNGTTLPETFTFTTDAGIPPSLFVNFGSCVPWTISGNQSTSPSIIDHVNSIHTISSSIPFTSVTISSTDNNIHGGSVFALCYGSLVQDCPTESYNLGNDTSICLTDTITLDATTPNSSYLWQNGSTTPKFHATESGDFWVTINKEGCLLNDTISIFNLEPPPSITESIILCSEAESLTLQAEYDEEYIYYWQDGTTNATNVVNSEGSYSVIISNSCGSNTSEFTVESQQCFCEVYIPNSFTPDGNETNNNFAVYSICDLSQYRFEVFNRWGDLLFVSNDLNAFWDGSFNGKTAPTGLYSWKLTYSFNNENSQIRVGHVSLLR